MIIINTDIIFNWIFVNLCNLMHIAMEWCIGFSSLIFRLDCTRQYSSYGYVIWIKMKQKRYAFQPANNIQVIFESYWDLVIFTTVRTMFVAYCINQQKNIYINQHKNAMETGHDFSETHIG